MIFESYWAHQVYEIVAINILVNEYFGIIELSESMMKKLTRMLWIAFFVGGIVLAFFFGFYDYLRGDIKGTFGFVQKLGVLNSICPLVY
jgi:hypothetical protein